MEGFFTDLLSGCWNNMVDKAVASDVRAPWSCGGQTCKHAGTCVKEHEGITEGRDMSPVFGSRVTQRGVVSAVYTLTRQDRTVTSFSM